MGQPWDQQPGESDAAYRRFLRYRDLGMGRSIDAAYFSTRPPGAGAGLTAAGKRRRAPGQWMRECSRWRWRERASKWDIDHLQRRADELLQQRYPRAHASEGSKSDEIGQKRTHIRTPGRAAKGAKRRQKATSLRPLVLPIGRPSEGSK
jgi:hypothetical protein